EPPGRLLVGRAEMRTSARGQTLRGGLEHQTERDAHAPQLPHVLARHDARVEMREQARLLQHRLGCTGQVFDGGVAAESGQLVASRAVAQLRLVPEGEEGFAAAGSRARTRDLEDFLNRQVSPLAAARRLRKRAVVTHVATE